MEHNTFEQLRSAAWVEIGRRLLRAGLAIARDTGALGHGVAPADVEDVVSQTFEEVCSGAARWDPERGELYPFLKVVFRRRLIDRLRAKRPEVPLVAADNPVSGAPVVPSVEAMLASTESDSEVERKVALVFQLCADDEEAQAVIDAMMSDEGDYRPRAVANLTGMPVTRVNTVLTRIRRRASKHERASDTFLDQGGRHG